MPSSNGLMSNLIPLAVVVIVMLVRLRRADRPRPFKPRRLWVVPLLYLVMVAALLAVHPPAWRGWLLFGAGLAVGSALGWQRGKLTRIEHDPVTGGLVMRQSRAGLVLIFAIVGVRMIARQALLGSDAPNPQSLGTVLLVTDTMLGFALGFLAVQRVEMGLRARAMLAGATR